MQCLQKYKSGLFGLLLGALLALTPYSGAQAADCSAAQICTGFGQCWETDARDVFVMGRVSPADWDLSIWENLTILAREESFAWGNWVSYPFSLEYRKSDGLITFTLNGSTVLTAAAPARQSFETILPIVGSLAAGTGAELTGMNINGTPVCDLTAFNSLEGLRIPLSDAAQPDGFTLTGSVRLMWTSAELQTIPAFYIYALNAHCAGGGTEGPQGDPTCSDGIDNDCDGWLDAQDSGCTPPPLPLFQNIGREDILYNNLTETECRLCHGNQSDGFSMPDRHHLLVGTVIPDFTLSSGGVPGELYACLTCHPAECAGSECDFPIERDCTVCHMQGMPSDLTVHHRSNLAQGTLPQGPDCKICHGSVVDNIYDGHFVSSEPVLESTPRRSGGVGEPLNSRGTGSGGCDYCHDYGVSETGLNIVTNQLTHHNTGLGFDSTKCGWCHDFSRPLEEQIRTCENCHGRDSLHNIQTDSNGDGVIEPGVELPFYGHVGNPEDCWGCHGYGPASTIAPESGVTVPSLFSISETFITAWYHTPLTLTGSAFISVDNGTVHSSEVVLVNGDGDRTLLAPDAITEDTIEVTIPGITLPGTYLVKVVKLSKESNALALMVKPDVRIVHVDCQACTGEITITGAGFGSAPIEENQEFINVTEDGIPLSVLSWHEYQITALGSCSGTIAVNNVFGTATVNID